VIEIKTKMIWLTDRQGHKISVWEPLKHSIKLEDQKTVRKTKEREKENNEQNGCW